jgi:hypothetical protein
VGSAGVALESLHVFSYFRACLVLRNEAVRRDLRTFDEGIQVVKVCIRVFIVSIKHQIVLPPSISTL